MSASPATMREFSNQPDAHIIASADIYSWKLKKDFNGGVFAVYCVHVSLKCGIKWIIERRYTQFRELRKELIKIRPEIKNIPFPGKVWMFNLSKSSLKARQDTLNSFLSELTAITPQLLEIAIFLEVEINLSQGQKNMGSRGSNMKRSASFGSLNPLLSIKDFHVIKVLGKGSFGKVFLVRPHNAPLSEVYAIKVLRKSEVIKRHQVEHTLTERHILATIRHPFILSLRHAFQTSDKLFMVTDYCCGGELFFHLRRLKRFTEGMMRFYSAQISVALAHLHAHHIIYRDLKPENVLLDRQGFVKLTDFGLSKQLPSHGSSNSRHGMRASELTFCGTPEYLSPEMILHRRNSSGYGREVDWWSLGIVCFELITGLPPFFDRDFNRMCEKILYRPLNFPSQKFNLSKDAEDLVRCLLQREPHKRLHYQLDAAGLPELASSISSTTSSLRRPVPASPLNEKERYCLQKHPFFSDMDWSRLLECSLEPPFVPPRPQDVADTCNFDKEFTKLSIRLSVEEDSSGPANNGVARNSRGFPSVDNRGQARDFFLGFSFSINDTEDLPHAALHS